MVRLEVPRIKGDGVYAGQTKRGRTEKFSPEVLQADHKPAHHPRSELDPGGKSDHTKRTIATQKRTQDSARRIA